jgi:hypothetical protein
MINKKNGAKAVGLNRQEVHDFIQAFAIGGSQHVKVSKLINFMDSGAIQGPPSKGAAQERARSMVPRVATLVFEKQKTMKEEKGTLGDTGLSREHHRRRTFGGFARELKLPDGVYKEAPQCLNVNKVERTRQVGGQCWKETSNVMSEKVTVTDITKPGDGKESKAVERQITPRGECIVADKISGDRVITPRLAPGNIDWTKINHCSQEVFADPEHSRPNLPRRNEGNHVRIGEGDRKPITHRVCLADKVTEQNRQPLADIDYKRIMANRMAEKVTDAGRIGTGWAAPYGEASSDKCRSIANKSSGGNIGPVGGYPMYR